MFTQGALALVLGFSVGSVSAASFDCSKASGFAESEICRDGYLSGVDEVLNRTYTKAISASSNPEGLRQTQRQWLVVRNQCQDQTCLDRALGNRIQALEGIIRDEQIKARQAQDERAAAQRYADDAERERQKAVLAQQQRKSAQPLQRTPSQTASNVPAVHANGANTQQANPVTTWFINGPGWKYTLVLGFLLSAWAVVRHHRGSATIYSDYTDALITNLLPALGIVIAGICRWLEMPGMVSTISVIAGFVLSISYAVYSTVKNNRGALSIFLTIMAKLTLISVFYAVIGLLIASLFSSTRRKGESQARADSRNRRERKATMAMIAALSAAYSALTVWICRNPKFTSVGECLEFNRVPELP
ncbi:hypothetical protein ACIOVF_17435 [Pseudomonas sp. NPDC087612]|uniref:hypothetical protein n=1 Tax=Pseudomonas sp. NPDC087612 TaxID=3364441 RepID=UPI003810CCBB